MRALLVALLASCSSSAPPAKAPAPTLANTAIADAAVAVVGDVPEDETVLNSKRWKFAAYFNQLKRAIYSDWDPRTVWRRLDGSHAYGTATRTTVVEITLTPAGALQKIAVTQGSGVPELDDEAVRSAHAASPFGTPPEGAPLKFLFSFVFEIGTSTTETKLGAP
jgi:TonB family protein